MPKPSSTTMVQIVRVAGSRSMRAEIVPALKGAAPLSFMFPHLEAPRALGRAGVGAHGSVKRDRAKRTWQRGAQTHDATPIGTLRFSRHGSFALQRYAFAIFGHGLSANDDNGLAASVARPSAFGFGRCVVATLRCSCPPYAGRWPTKAGEARRSGRGLRRAAIRAGRAGWIDRRGQRRSLATGSGGHGAPVPPRSRLADGSAPPRA